MANFGFSPYEEAAAKGQARVSLMQRLGQIFSGAGQGIAASQNAQNPLEAGALGFAGSFGASQASRQAAEQYAMKKIEADRANEERQARLGEIAARTKRLEAPPPPPKETPIDPLIEEKRALLKAQAAAAQARASKPPAAGPKSPGQRADERIQINRQVKLAKESNALIAAEDPAELLKVSNDMALEPETRRAAWSKYLRITGAQSPAQVR